LSLYLTEEKTSSFYIHWPFCPYRCFYCPFIAIAGQDEFMEKYHEALITEIKTFATKQSTDLFTGALSKEEVLAACAPEPWRKSDKKNIIFLETLYFGGGTPSTYPLNLLLDTFAILRNEFSFSDNPEITLEVNPGTVTENHLKIWQEIGINRVSIGVQSFNEKALTDVNRHQKVKDVIWLLSTIFSYIKNVSVDIILGLPGVSKDDWQSMLKKLVSFPITHISMYILEIHDTTQLFYKLQKKELHLPHEEETIELFYWSCNFLKEAGFNQYEISNFSRNNYYSRHNTAYWEQQPFKGFGLGAWSFDGKQRLGNEKNLMLYIKKASEQKDVEIETEVISSTQRRTETIMLGLRRACGVAYQLIVAGNEEERKKEKVEKLIQEGFMVKTADERLILTARGLIVENRIVSEII